MPISDISSPSDTIPAPPTIPASESLDDMVKRTSTPVPESLDEMVKRTSTPRSSIHR